MRVAFFLLLLCTLGSKTAAQSVTWLSSCSNKSFCLNNNSCTHGKVTLKEKAHSTCSNPGLFYSYQIDIGNNFSVDIKGNADSVSVDLPLGTHSIVWRATDNCLNVNTCSYLITVRDCVSPSLACINGLTQSLDEPFCMEEFSAEQFVLSVSDNCTPKNQLEYGLEITGTGTGFPKQSKLSFNQCDKGLNFVSVFVRDKSGLINTCNCYVLLQTNSGGCECNKAADLYPSGCIRTPYNRAVKPYTLAYRFESTAGISIPIVKPGLKVLKDSCYRDTISDLPFGADYKGTIEVSRKKDPLNGVTTYDLVLISRHILGLETFTSAYQVLAADVNKSGSVTSFDIVELRKLVLGVYDTLPNMPSWRFIQPLSKPSDILSFKTARDTYQIILPALNVDLELPDKHFIAVKMGDVNGTADPQLNTSQPREENPLVLKANGRRLNAGETAWIDIYPASSAVLQSWQLELGFDATRITVEDVQGVEAENYRFDAQSGLRILWFSPEGEPEQFGEERPFFRILVKARQSVQLAQAIWIQSTAAMPALAYTGASERDVHSLRLEIGSGAGTQLIGAPRPNPFEEATSWPLRLMQPADVHLELFDAAGRLVYQQQLDMPAGAGQLDVRLADLPGRGLYSYRISVNDWVKNGWIAAGFQ